MARTSAREANVETVECQNARLTKCMSGLLNVKMHWFHQQDTKGFMFCRPFISAVNFDKGITYNGYILATVLHAHQELPHIQ